MGKESKERVCTITINVEGEPAEYLTHVEIGGKVYTMDEIEEIRSYTEQGLNSGLHTVEEVDKKTENQ